MKELIAQMRALPESVRLDIANQAKVKQRNRVMNGMPVQGKPQPNSLAAIMANRMPQSNNMSPRRMGGLMGTLMRGQ